MHTSVYQQDVTYVSDKCCSSKRLINIVTSTTPQTLIYLCHSVVDTALIPRLSFKCHKAILANL